MFSKDSQHLKVPKAIFEIPSGNFTFFRFLQFTKHSSPIDFTESEIITLSKDLQFINAMSSIHSTESGTIISLVTSQLPNALLPIDLTELGISTLVSDPL